MPRLRLLPESWPAARPALPQPGSRDARLAALVLLGAGLAVIFGGLAAALQAWGGGEAAALAAQRDGYARLVARRPAVEAALAGLAGRRAEGEDFLSGASPALAGAELQSRIASLVQAAGGRLDRSEVLPEQQEEGFRRVGLRVHVTAPLPALRRILYQIEAGTPRLFVERLSIEAGEAGGRTAAHDSPLDIGFAVHGYLAEGRQ